MTDTPASNKMLGQLLHVICFTIGCLFLYWAVNNWIMNNFDANRYEISKIQPPGGGDSWSFWKLDSRTGNTEFCTLEVAQGGGKEFTCQRAKLIEQDDGKLKSNAPAAAQ